VTRAPRVLISDRQRSLRVDRRRLAAEVAEVLRRVRFPGDLSLSLVDDGEMRRLHALHSHDDTATDVLAFPLEGPRPPGADFPAAEVVLSVETAVREARARGLRPRTEVLLYAVHGVLHLRGEDDHDPVRAARMDRRTLALLRALGYRHRIGRRE
jgi:probable rRNA maturation factor